MVKPTGDKGYIAEEALRGYFRSAGYFAVRGIPLTYRKFDVTDVDLWLYLKTSTLTADRTCVDIKSKRTPQAMERVLWTRGLKEILRVDRAIVVTPDNRPETRDFGTAHGVGIMQGDFLHLAIATFPPTGRLTEEEFYSIINTACIVDSKIEWRSWFKRLKSRLLDSLNFDGCNKFLVQTRLLLDEYLASSKSSVASVRLLYIAIAYFLICLDYTSRSFVHLDLSVRASILTNGFRYGEGGRQRTDDVVQMATLVLAEAGKADFLSAETLRIEFEKQTSDYPAEILGEYFAKGESLKSLFGIARNFEEHAYAKTLLLPHEISSEQKAILGLICDFFRCDRKAII
jgi:hypothetical protein